ncbi:solute carrier family 12 member 8 [Pectinophora gossypiella]|uniref:solute carrier family 12 member 8 n=1 Tax=Pectinophora gossypiella TaxID=13191 RepID=UPI00214F5348|nr:solute carrier family 12 member 8 [Pectinophora gossypiella]
MEQNNQSRRNDLDSFRNDEPGFDRARMRRQSGGFVDLGNESQYGSGGHQASGANEIFADIQGDVPWWKSNFFISQPVLFGTWDGVFTSCLINIFGVIVFLRSGWLVGQAGIVNAVFIVIFTVFVALISVLSAVGICERCRIESGGVYFLLAHTLGSRMGGSLGMVYCFGQAVGCALNVYGFGESMASLVNVSAENQWPARGFAIAALILLATINVAGVKWVIKLQFILLLIILLAALDFFVGSFTSVTGTEFKGWMGGTMANNTWSQYEQGNSWFTCFGVFFPTITGILAGINMSGDLKNPSANIPSGSLAAISTGTFLYLMFIITLAATVTRTGLQNNLSITADISAVTVLLLAGLYVSSMSSCLGAMYGTPRVLQSIANERVIPGLEILGRGRGPNKVPIYSMVVVAIVTITFIIIGDINALAPIVTMPFLITYASIDYSYFALAQTFDLQHKREMRFQGHSQRDTQVYGATGSDLDLLFPERIRHKTVGDFTPSPTDPAIMNGRLSNGDAVRRPSVSVHSKNKNWYSHLCNRWLSLSGVAIKLLLMFLVHWMYALGCLSILWLLWLYIGAANPAVKPGRASEFRFFHWLKISFLQAIGKRPLEYEQLVVTPVHADITVEQERLNDDNEDFASRRRYHQSTALQSHLVNVDA